MVGSRLGLELGLGITLTLLITMIIRYFKCFVKHYKYVNNASQMGALS